MKRLAYLSLLVLIIIACSKPAGTNATSGNVKSDVCSAECQAKNMSTNVSCKLTSDELQKRKATVIESLSKQVIEKKELENGYAFKFNGSDEMLDQLNDFIKSERACCDFFTFNLSIGGDKKEIWLSLTGPADAKKLIGSEIGL